MAALQLRHRHRVLHNPSLLQSFSSSTTSDTPESDFPPIKPRGSSFSKKSLSTIFKSLKSNTAFHKPVGEYRHSLSRIREDLKATPIRDEIDRKTNLRPSWFGKEVKEIESRIGYNYKLRSSLLSVMQSNEEKTTRSIDIIGQSNPGPDSVELPQKHLGYFHPYNMSSVEKELAKFRDEFKMPKSGSLKAALDKLKVDAARPKAPKPPKSSKGKTMRKKVENDALALPEHNKDSLQEGDSMAADDEQIIKLVSLQGLSSLDIFLGKVESSQARRLILQASGVEKGRRLKAEASSKLKDDLAQAKKDIATLEAELKHKTNQLSSFEQSLALVTKEVADLKAALKGKKKQRSSATKEVDDLTAAVSRLYKYGPAGDRI